jgi:hypothetical protein
VPESVVRLLWGGGRSVHGVLSRAGEQEEGIVVQGVLRQGMRGRLQEEVLRPTVLQDKEEGLWGKVRERVRHEVRAHVLLRCLLFTKGGKEGEEGEGGRVLLPRLLPVKGRKVRLRRLLPSKGEEEEGGRVLLRHLLPAKGEEEEEEGGRVLLRQLLPAKGEEEEGGRVLLRHLLPAKGEEGNVLLQAQGRLLKTQGGQVPKELHVRSMLSEEACHELLLCGLRDWVHQGSVQTKEEGMQAKVQGLLLWDLHMLLSRWMVGMLRRLWWRPGRPHDCAHISLTRCPCSRALPVAE